MAQMVEREPDLLAQLLSSLSDTDPAVVAHAAHAAMQLSARQPGLFDPHVQTLIETLRAAEYWELGEQLPKILVRSKLSANQHPHLIAILLRNLEHKSNIVAVCALQALVDLALDGRADRAVARRAIDDALLSDRKALSARARKLQRQLGSAF